MSRISIPSTPQEIDAQLITLRAELLSSECAPNYTLWMKEASLRNDLGRRISFLVRARETMDAMLQNATQQTAATGSKEDL